MASRFTAESVSGDGLKTQTIVYQTGERQYKVVYINDIVAQYGILSN